MENLQPPFGDQISQHLNILQESQDTHSMERRHTVTEDPEALLLLSQYEREHMNPEQSNASLAHSETGYEKFTDASLQHDQTQPIKMNDSLRLDAENMETCFAASQIKFVETSQTSVRSSQQVHSFPKLHEEISDTLCCSSSSAHINNIYNPSNLHATLHFPTSVHQEKQNPQCLSPPLHIKPATRFANINQSFVNPHVMPHFNPSWPVLVPHLNPAINASVLHHNPFCPIYMPKLNFNLPFKSNFKAPVACENHSYSSLVLQPHLNVYPVCPTPNIYQPKVQMIRTDRDHPGRFLRDVQDSFRLWQRLCETARLFCSDSPDAEALACFFMRVIPSLSIHRSDLPFSAAVNAAVQEWWNTSNFERQQYYNTAMMFIEMEKQDKSINRAIPQTDKSKDRRLPHSSGELKKTGKRSKTVSVQDLTENALNEYSQVMDSLESKVTAGSEVMVADEEDVCALFLNQLLNDSDSTSEAGFDIDYISSLLSTDTFSNVIPEPVAGCSDWTYSTVSETQILSSSAVQHDFSPSKGTNPLLSEDHVVEKIFVPFQDNMKGEFQISTEPLPVNPEGRSSKTDPNTLFHETIHPELQDFGPEVDGNQKDKTLFVAAQSNCFNLQNYNSHQAIFPQTIKHDPETPIDGGMENDGEENMVVSQKTENYVHVGNAEENNNMDSDIPDDSQRTRSFCNKQTNMKESPNIDKSKENNVNKNKRHKRRHRRHQKITLPVERMSLKLDNKDKRRLKTENQPGKTDSATKHEVQETDFKIIVEKVEFQQHANITETTSSAMKGRRGSSRQRDKQIRKIREHLDDGFERKTLRRQVRERCLTKAERDGGKTYRRAEGGCTKKQENVLTIEKDRGDFRSSREVSMSTIMKKDANKTQHTNDKRSTQKQAKKEG